MVTQNSKKFLQAIERLLCSEWESTLKRIESGELRNATLSHLLDPDGSLEGWEARDEAIAAYLMLKGEIALSETAPSQPKTENKETSSKSNTTAPTSAPSASSTNEVSPRTMPLTNRSEGSSMQTHVVPFPAQPKIAASAQPKPVSLTMAQHGAAARAMSIDERNQPLNVPVEQSVIRKASDRVPAQPAQPAEDERNRPMEANKQASTITSDVTQKQSLKSEPAKRAAAEKPAFKLKEVTSIAPTVKTPAQAATPETADQGVPVLQNLKTELPVPTPAPAIPRKPRMSLPSSLPSAVGSTKIAAKDEPASKQPLRAKKQGFSTDPSSKSKDSEEDLEAKTESERIKYRCEVKAITDEEILEKHSALLTGVKYQRYRDFVLAEGTKSGTSAPTLIICTLTDDWLEFQFPYEEGQRLLQKYPQRDQELAQLIVSKSRVNRPAE